MIEGAIASGAGPAPVPVEGAVWGASSVWLENKGRVGPLLARCQRQRLGRQRQPRSTRAVLTALGPFGRSPRPEKLFSSAYVRLILALAP
jgi:hypothetical protein